jgi:LacI family transcriptional regulator
MRSSPTLDELAAAAGVSRMTASRALNNRPGVSEPNRERIVQLAKEMGYIANPAAVRLASGWTRVIGLLCIDMDAPFVAEIVKGALRAARAASCETLIYSLLEPGEELRNAVAQILSRSTQGVVSLILHRTDYLAALTAAHIQVVTLENPDRTGYSITADHYNGSRAAVRHLVSLGHRRIAHIAGHEKIASTAERRRGYEEVLSECGLPRDRSLIEKGDNTQPTGFAAAQRLLALRAPPTAIFASNDSTALGVLEAAQTAGLRVPEDLSVVGFDDIPVAALSYPPLTTVRQPMEQMGRSAVNTLLALLAGVEAVSPVITFPTELIIRGSTAPPGRRRPDRAGPHRRKKAR